jgi:hypothetical protein
LFWKWRVQKALQLLFHIIISIPHHLHQIHIQNIGARVHNTLEVKAVPRIQSNPESEVFESAFEV